MDIAVFRIKTFLFVAIMFLASGALAIAAGYKLLYGHGIFAGEIGTAPIITSEDIPLTAFSNAPVKTSPSLPALQFLISFFIATAIMLAFIKFFKGKFFFEVFFSIAIWFGAQIIFGTMISGWPVFVLAGALVAFRFLAPYVFSQNIVLVVGIAGISASMGLTFSWENVAVVLSLLSVYDIIAVYKTKHMQKMFRGLAKKGAILAIIAPPNFNNFFTKISDVKPEENKFLFLGTGDIALPVFFAVSVLPFGLMSSISVVFGALAGLFAVHLLFTRQKERRPMPALPPIAAGAIIGFLLSIINFNQIINL